MYATQRLPFNRTMASFHSSFYISSMLFLPTHPPGALGFSRLHWDLQFQCLIFITKNDQTPRVFERPKPTRKKQSQHVPSGVLPIHGLRPLLDRGRSILRAPGTRGMQRPLLHEVQRRGAERDKDRAVPHLRADRR